MSRLYFIDSENVGDHWISLLSIASEDDKILVFYTAKSPHMNYKNLILLKESTKEVTFIECCEGNNALDFQLSTDLGYRIHNNSTNDFYIVSNDTGYDAVVKYWRRRNISIRRIQGKACATLLPPVHTLPEQEEPKKDVSTEVVTPEQPDAAITTEIKDPVKEPVKESVKDQPEETLSLPMVVKPFCAPAPVTEKKIKSETMDPDAKELLYIIGKDNLQTLHQALQQFYGATNSKNYYNALKSNAYNGFLANHKKLSLSEKYHAYCSIVFRLAEQKLAMPEDFPEFVMNTWNKKKNLNSFRASLQGRYGKNLSNKYYALIKAHVKILDKIK